MILRDLSRFSASLKGYTELRLQENRSTSVVLVKGSLTVNSSSSSSGSSARVYKDGCWGFSSSPELSDGSINAVIGAAYSNARFLDTKEKKGKGMFPASFSVTSHDFSTKKPRLAHRQLIEFTRELDSYIVKNCPGLVSRSVSLNCLDMEKALVTSYGSQAYSMTPRAFIGCTLSVEKDGRPVEVYSPSGGLGQFEDLFGSPSDCFDKIDLLYEHLMKKKDGIYAEAGTKVCVLDAALAGVLAHEAIGHTTEADLVLGGSVAGGLLGKEAAAPIVSVVDYANTAFGKTCPVPVYTDDEGVEAEDAVIIDRGILKGFMHNRESALHFETKPQGNARAFLFSDEPLIRMRNTAIVPGSSKLEDMIASVDDGYYLMHYNNGQADTTSEFMFGITMGYEIKSGKLGRAILDTTISGIAYDVLKTVSMVSSDVKWTSSGMCGKKQLIPVGLGGPALKCTVNIGGR